MKIFQYVTVSLILHALIWTLLSLRPESSAQNETIEVSYIDKKPEPAKKQKSIVTVEQDQLLKSLKKLSEAADKLSAQTNRVQQEQAKKGDAPMDQQRQVQRGSPRPQVKNAWDPPPLAGAAEMARRELNEQAEQQGFRGFTSNVGLEEMHQIVPEVKTGRFTALNTDQFIFYTFHARTRQQIANRWVQNLRYTFNNLSQAEYSRLIRAGLIRTQFQIVLNPEGEFIKVIYEQRSASKDFDEAAVLAVVRATPFVNPPEEMVQDDGYIHLNYAFEVEMAPRSWARESN